MPSIIIHCTHFIKGGDRASRNAVAICGRPEEIGGNEEKSLFFGVLVLHHKILGDGSLGLAVFGCAVVAGWRLSATLDSVECFAGMPRFFERLGGGLKGYGWFRR